MCRALGSRAWSQMDGLDLSLGTDTWPRCTLPSFWDSVFYIKNAPKWGQLRSYLSQWWPHYMVQTGFTFPLLWFLMVFLLVLATWPSDPLTCCSLLYLVSNPPPKCSKKLPFCLAQLNLVSLSCNSALTDTARFQDENMKSSSSHLARILLPQATAGAWGKGGVLKHVTKWDLMTELKFYIITLERILE